MSVGMLTIDGSAGEGGGQIVRSALALSAVSGKPFTIHRIRAGRSRPGLRAQHLASVTAAAQICGARVRGAELGSQTLTFEPGALGGGEYVFRVGTAGSATLVLQTVLPALVTAPEPSTVLVEGGTHNPWAPPFEFLARVYLPLLNRMGPHVAARLLRHGFYPAGGGRLSVSIQPAESLRGLQLCERGKLQRESVTAVVANLPRHIGQRELETIRRKSSWPKDRFELCTVDDAAGPGNAVLIGLEFANVTEVFSGFGRRGLPAERVAEGAYREAKKYLAADVPVGPYLADQLLLPLGFSASQSPDGGGQFRTLPLTRHSSTHIGVLQAFLGNSITVHEEADGVVTVQVGAFSVTDGSPRP